jgi:hypothetical protein
MTYAVSSESTWKTRNSSRWYGPGGEKPHCPSFSSERIRTRTIVLSISSNSPFIASAMNDATKTCPLLSENRGVPSLPTHARPYAPDRRRSRRNAAAFATAASSVAASAETRAVIARSPERLDTANFHGPASSAAALDKRRKRTVRSLIHGRRLDAGYSIKRPGRSIIRLTDLVWVGCGDRI